MEANINTIELERLAEIIKQIEVLESERDAIKATVMESMKVGQKHSYSLDAYSGYEDLDVASEDQYQLYGRTFVVRGISLVVRDEVIGECLQFIPPNKRAVLLLSFFGELSDSEIAAFLRISKATVTYRKKRWYQTAAGHDGGDGT